MNKSKKPAYLQVYFELKRTIQENYAIGDMLPAEPVLEKQYNVSRITLRKAIQMLSDQGYIHVQQGKGTIITDPSTVQRINYLTSTSETLRNEGYNVKSTNLHIDESIPPKDVLDLLRLPEGSSVYRIQRIITADNRPIAIATNYIIQGFVPNLINFQNNIQSLYTFIEQHYEVALSNATDYITARSANIEQSNILHIPLNSPLIYLRRFVYTKGTPLTCDDMLIDASRYKFSVNLVGRPPSSALKK